MAKRPPSTQPPDPPAVKRVHLSERYEKANKQIHQHVPVLRNAIDEDQLLSFAMSQILCFAPPEAYMKDMSLTGARKLIEKNLDLKRALQDAVQQGEYQDVMFLPVLQKDLQQIIMDPLQFRNIDHPTQHDLDATFNAFSTPYVGNFPQALLGAVDFYANHRGEYNSTISIIQSSGTGKSRGVIETAKIRFAFMFSLGRDTTYPPPDVNVRNYFLEGASDSTIQIRYAAFFYSLFICTQERISNVDRAGAPLPEWWYMYLNSQGTTESPGPERVRFYDEVIERSKPIVQVYSGNTGELYRDLRTSCSDFVDFVEAQYGQKPLRAVPCLLVFDEAQELAFGPRGHERNYFHHLRSVVSEISGLSIFAVFLSTHLSTPTPVPPPGTYRGTRPWKPQPPVTELPFDVFAWNLNTELARDGRSTLSGFCSLDVMVRFGRAMWYSMYTHVQGFIIELAKRKLNPMHTFHQDKLAQFACLAIRIGLDFDASREIGRAMQTKLVDSYMRVVFAVPSHQEYMRTGTPSEPVLAEAAAQLLNGEESMSMKTLAPDMLSHAFRLGFLAREKRGEMVARLLWTLAYDQVPKESHPDDPVKFHKPIRVLDFLRHLFHERHWDVILSAKPMGDADGLPLSEAFNDAYICFSHFTDAVDYDIDLGKAYRLLLRGAALNCHRSQRSIDFLAPVLFGSPDSTPLKRSNTSVMQARVQNHPQEEVFVDPTSVHTNRFVLSIVYALGAPESAVECHTPYGPTSDAQHDRRHYRIVSRGCTSETFGVIPNSMNGAYAWLLGSDLLMEDFPRRGREKCASLFHQMQPCRGLYGGQKGKENPGGKNDAMVPVQSWFGKDTE